MKIIRQSTQYKRILKGIETSLKSWKNYLEF